MSRNFIVKSNLNFKYLKILWFIIDVVRENIANILLINCDLREKLCVMFLYLVCYFDFVNRKIFVSGYSFKILAVSGRYSDIFFESAVGTGLF